MLGSIQFYSATGESSVRFQPAFEVSLPSPAAEPVATVNVEDLEGRRRAFLVLESDGASYYAPIDGGELAPGSVPLDRLICAPRSPLRRPRRAPSDALPGCFVKGTKIRASGAYVPVESLRPGDLIDTLDQGPMALRWVGRAVQPGRGGFTPVRLRQGAFGALGPDVDIEVSQQQQILITGARAAALYGRSEILVPAGEIVDRTMVTFAPRPDIVRWYALLLERPAVMVAGGVGVQSFNPAAPADWSDAFALDDIKSALEGLSEALQTRAGASRSH